MTVAPSTTVTIYALGGGAVGPFSTIWPFAEDDDVAVYLRAGDVTTRLTVGVDYSLTAPSPLTSGGTVLLLGPHDGQQLVLSRESGTGQPFAFGEAIGFSPKSLEDALDLLARQIQEMRTALANGGFAGSGGGGGSDPTLTFALIVAALGYIPENFAHRGVANGYAPLGADAKVPSAFLPAAGGGGAADTVTGATLFEGLPSYADNAAAVAGGLVPGQPYLDGDVLQIVHA